MEVSNTVVNGSTLGHGSCRSCMCSYDATKKLLILMMMIMTASFFSNSLLLKSRHKVYAMWISTELRAFATVKMK